MKDLWRLTDQRAMDSCAGLWDAEEVLDAFSGQTGMGLVVKLMRE